MSELPNILFFCATDRYSGGEIVLERIISGLVQHKKCNPYIVCSNDTLLKNLTAIEMTNVFKLQNVKSLKSNGDKRSFKTFIYQMRECSKQLEKIIHTFKIDIIHANSLDSAFYSLHQAKKNDIPLIWHNHNVIKRFSADYFFASLLSLNVDKIISVSHSASESLPFFNKNKSNVVFNGVDGLYKFNPNLVANLGLDLKYKIPPNTLKLGYVGQIHPSKGIEIILNTLFESKSESPNQKMTLFIAGKIDRENKYFKDLLQNISILNLSDCVFFVGHLNKIEQFYKDIDILILPSLKPEAFPTVLLEASAMEKIVISSNLGGGSEIIKDNITGFLFTPSISHQLKEKLTYLISNKSVQNKIRKKAREYILANFDFDSQIKNISKIYSEIIK